MKKEEGKIKKAGAGRWRFPPFAFCLFHFAFIGLALPVLAQTNSAPEVPNAETSDGTRHFNIQEYHVSGGAQLPTNILAGIFAPYIGTNRSVDDLVKAASELQRAYRAQGYPAMSISVAGGQITNGIVTLNVFYAPSPQILVSGRHYASAASAPPALPAAEPSRPQINPIATGVATNIDTAAAAGTVVATAAATNAVPAPTNAGPRFRVDNYLVAGNSILSPEEISGVFTNVPAAFGTNVTVDAILKAAGNLQTAYRDRGYMTVVVGLPPQKLTNAEVNVKVTEAPLVAINVQNEGAHYFSSNNVMRALPDLHTNMLLNSKIFQSELDLANQNRDRQIYPTVGPGPQPGTSELTLGVKDRLPWHARLELNNDQSTPGTPDLRVNFSTEYDNLWDLEHQVGLQYSFSPEQFKTGNDYVQVPFDEPLVSSYSAYYRLPLGGYPSMQDRVNGHRGSFGYNEATHQFNLPPSTGRPELTLYASRSVSDTGVQQGPTGFASPPGTFTNNGVVYTPLAYTTNSAGENITLDEDVGGKLVWPLPQTGRMALTFSFGADYKVFQQTSYNTNENNFMLQYTDQQGNLQTINSYVPQGYPPVYTSLYYLPLNAGLSGSVADKLGTTFFNSQVNFNVLPGFSEDQDFARVAPDARQNYVTVQLGADRVQAVYKDWSVKLHADGQWANGTLIGNEQYAMGGATGVRGYQSGTAYGDMGWRMVEPQTPPFNLGLFGNQGSAEACWVRGSVFMDYGQVSLLHGEYNAAGIPPNGPVTGPLPAPRSRLDFWGTGWSISANIGSHLDARLTMAFPLMDPAGRPGFDPGQNMQIYFGIGGQF
jgi:hemolysin activation/secretion protein